MGNIVTIEARKFTNKNGDETYGYCAYDFYDKTYYNCAETNIMEMDDLELLAFAKARADDRLGAMIDFCCDENHGLYINNTWYEYEEIKTILEA